MAGTLARRAGDLLLLKAKRPIIQRRAVRDGSTTASFWWFRDWHGACSAKGIMHLGFRPHEAVLVREMRSRRVKEVAGATAGEKPGRVGPTGV